MVSDQVKSKTNAYTYSIHTLQNNTKLLQHVLPRFFVQPCWEHI